ncbi:MAG: PcfB family protein [Negativicutes bacterium]|nr:PcfB family protein [Negativicutes bacterium]
MQEEVVNRTVALAVNSSRMTTHVLKAALIKLLAEMKRSRDSPLQIPHGKQTVKALIGQNAGVSNIEITDKNIKSFEQVARKYGVDYALKKDNTGDKPKYLVFFKARDADALTAAFTEYTAKVLKKDKQPSILEQLAKFKILVQAKVIDRVKNKDKELTR